MDSILLQSIMGVLAKKILVPTDFQSQAEAVALMQKDDMSGLVDSLTDFSVNSACVDFSIETKNKEFTKTLKKWLDEINIDYQGKVPIGIKELAREYFKERWKYSSFAVLKIVEWKPINGILVPTKMFFVDGTSIHAEDKDSESQNLNLINYDYYLGLGKKNKLDKNVIFAKSNGRWFDEYPTPYLVKRGAYHNWKIIQLLKEMQVKILDQVIPYMLLIKKGFKGTNPETSKFYSDPQLKEVIADLQALVTEIHTNSTGDKNTKSPVRATNFDEEIKHLIPDLSTIFDPKLFAEAERSILSGLGFIDVIQGISDTRRESILNPKIFIEEVKSGISDFKQILNQLVYLIIAKNQKLHRKYINNEFYITSSPIKGFMTDDFKKLIRSLFDRGRVSSQTAVELIAEIDFRNEVFRREKEENQGISEILYPPVIKNTEDKGKDLPSDFKTPEEENKDNIPDDKKGIEKENYDMSSKKFSCSCPKCGTKKIAPEGKHCNEIKCPKCGSFMRRVGRPGTGRPDKSPNAKKSKAELEGSPYPTLQSLPSAVKKLSKKKQRTFQKAWNRAYYYKLAKTGNKKTAETYAFKVAYSAIKTKKKAKRNKKEK